MCLHQHSDSSVLVHIVHYSHSCPVITTNRLQWNLSNAAPPLFMLLFLFRCRCACVKDEPGFKPKPSKQTTVKARRRSWGSDHRPSSWLTTCSAHLSVHTERKGLGVCSDALVLAAGFHTLCDLMLERSGSDLTSSLWKHVSCVC